MRDLYLCVLAFVCLVVNSAAKTWGEDYYTRDTLVKAGSEQFRVEKEECSTFVSYAVFNVGNSHDRMRVFKRDDGTIYFPGAELPVDKFHRAFRATFRKARARELFKPHGGCSTMGITYIVDSASGKTLEVYFSLTYYLSDDRHAIFSITPDELERFESNLKRYVVWNIPEEFKDAPYCVMSHSV